MRPKSVIVSNEKVSVKAVCWASGLFVGEGSVMTVVSKNSSGEYPYIKTVIGMCDERSIKRFAKIFGWRYGRVWLKNRGYWFYTCQMAGRTAERVLSLMRPYIENTDKGDQALEVAKKLGVENRIIGKRLDIG